MPKGAPAVEMTVAADGYWKRREHDGERPYLMLCEYSKSSRASCRTCGEAVLKGHVRLGHPVKWRGGGYGYISSWKHVKCSHVEGSKEYIASVVHGLELLKPEDRAETLEQLASNAKVEVETIDPNDEQFNKRPDRPGAAPAPATMTKEMLPYQQEGLAFMLAQEKGVHKGGILADEMGMGKTCQVIALLLQAKLNAEAAKKGKGKDKADDAPAPYGTTLVVAPTSAVTQWKDEIAAFSKEKSLKVMLYYEKRDLVTKEELLEYDVILTTYPVIEIEYRKVMNTYKVSCPYCSKKFLQKSLEAHLKYFCGPDAARTAKQAKTDKTRKEANKKAMATLRITTPGEGGGGGGSGTGPPTMSAIYKELMNEAGREAIGYFEPGHTAKARQAQQQQQQQQQQVSAEALAEALSGAMSEQATASGSGKKTKPKRKAPARKPTPKEESEEEWRSESDESDDDAAKSSSDSDVDLEAPGPSDDSPAMRAKGRADRAAARAAVQVKPAPADEAMDDEDDEVIVLSSDGDDGDDAKDSDFDVVDLTHDDGDDDGDADVAATPSSKRRAVDPPSSGVKPKTPKPKKPKQGRKRTAAQVKEEEEAAADEQAEIDAAAEEAMRGVEVKGETKYDLSPSLLHDIEWHRIVLDEAHKIKARTSSVAKAVFALRSEYKWCITGTPLQNRVGELYALVRFLRMDPFAYFYCKAKDCECKSLEWNFGPNTSHCECCGHTPMSHYSHFNKHIINPVNRYGFSGEGRKAMLTLKSEVLDVLQLRRTKKERAADVKLPPLTVKILDSKLNDEERDFYESLYKEQVSKFDKFVKKGTVLNNYAHIFELLARLRQAVDHPYLVVHKGRGGGGGGGADSKALPAIPAPTEVSEPVHYCGLCQEQVDVEDAALSGCKHVFHRTCIVEYTETIPDDGLAKCPVCKAKLTIDLQVTDFDSLPKHVAAEVTEQAKQALPSKSILSRIDLDKYTSSSKVEALTAGLQEMRRDDPKSKAIVFSQYTSMIDIVEWRLKKAGITTVKLLGSMPVQQRRAVLEAFRTDPNICVVLMSLKAGGEGLNLQVASHVFVLEPWWNPAVEAQAIQRAHRIGQTKPVTAVRFMTKGTIEERMFELQEKKQLVFEGAIDGSAAAISKLTQEDLCFLFKR